jgi:hypothetical protein
MLKDNNIVIVNKVMKWWKKDFKNGKAQRRTQKKDLFVKDVGL